MADDIDFLSGSCKQDVTDLICLSAYLNLNRRLKAGARPRLREVRSEGTRARGPRRYVHFLFGLPAFLKKKKNVMSMSFHMSF